MDHNLGGDSATHGTYCVPVTTWTHRTATAASASSNGNGALVNLGLPLHSGWAGIPGKPGRIMRQQLLRSRRTHPARIFHAAEPHHHMIRALLAPVCPRHLYSSILTCSEGAKYGTISYSLWTCPAAHACSCLATLLITLLNQTAHTTSYMPPTLHTWHCHGGHGMAHQHATPHAASHVAPISHNDSSGISRRSPQTARLVCMPTLPACLTCLDYTGMRTPPPPTPTQVHTSKPVKMPPQPPKHNHKQTQLS